MNLTDAQPQILDRLTELLGAPAVELAQSGQAVDLLARVGNHLVAVEFVAQAGAAHVGQAVTRLRQARGRVDRKALLVVVVPFMGPVGQQLCAAAGVHWLDLSGNARLVISDLRIQIEGKANRFKTAGRPPDLFSPMRSRVARRLLLDPSLVWAQSELVTATGLDPGYLSRTLKDLASAGLVARDSGRRVLVPDPDLLLRTWHAGYNFHQHQRLAGHVAARTSGELLQLLAPALHELGVAFALTGLPAAWRYAPMSGFRLVTLYVDPLPSVEMLKEVGFHAEARGANTWLLRPSDAGVFDGVADIGGLLCVHPVQVYLDLKAHPERSAEAADELRETCLNWRKR